MWLTAQGYFLTGLEAGSLNQQAGVGEPLASDENPLSGLQTASFCVLAWQRERSPVSPFLRVPIPSSHLTLTVKAPSPNTTTLRVRVSTSEFGGNTSSWSITAGFSGFQKTLTRRAETPAIPLRQTLLA